MAGCNGESFNILFNCVCTVINECELWQTWLRLKKCTSISENCIIKMGKGVSLQGAHVVWGPWQMFTPPSKNAFRRYCSLCEIKIFGVALFGFGWTC